MDSATKSVPGVPVWMTMFSKLMARNFKRIQGFKEEFWMQHQHPRAQTSCHTMQPFAEVKQVWIWSLCGQSCLDLVSSGPSTVLCHDSKTEPPSSGAVYHWMWRNTSQDRPLPSGPVCESSWLLLETNGVNFLDYGPNWSTEIIQRPLIFNLFI